jgi:carbonic anhydrase
MKRAWRSWFATLLVLVLGACQARPAKPAEGAHKVGWSYSGRTGPAHWGDLDPAYVLAKTGKEQSPVDIVPSEAKAEDEAPLAVDYQPTSLEILHNGHTVEDDYHGGGTLTVDGHTYSLAQFHFHSPSEHTVDGQHTALELHLVHKDADGKLAVIGVLIREGSAHPELARLWEHLPTEPGRKEAVEGVRVDAARLLPASLASFRYPGSLTTPPCSEGVSWLVLQQPIEASAEQVAAFRRVIHGNNRPTQPLHGREIRSAR